MLADGEKSTSSQSAELWWPLHKELKEEKRKINWFDIIFYGFLNVGVCAHCSVWVRENIKFDFFSLLITQLTIYATLLAV